ncbi:hypothetical protein ACO2Q9_08670 [Variovorax sp. VNK109]|jgi:hypothetical protein|uniref:hypothetical protein n=1 Tax=Variovorax sp. VNK109 TaxID=3400919 RepID=UPI003BFF047B
MKKIRNRSLSMARRARMRGQSMVEYIIVTSFSILILIETTSGDSVIQKLANAIKGAYQGFMYALGYSTNLNLF